MDKKSFIRGFGVGVLFAAIILGISFTLRTSDSYIKSRARELGMVYKESDSDLIFAEASPDVTAKPSKDKAQATDKPESTAAPTPKATPAVTPAPTPKITPEPKATAKPQKSASDSKKKMENEKKKMEESIRKEAKYLTINAGDWSSDVSEKLESLGIVKSAKDFDKYLNDNGYSSSISAGTYKVSIDDTYNELARKITGK